MRVRCGKCGELYDIYSSMGGQTFVCATCGSVLQMPPTDGKDVRDLKLCPNCRQLIDSAAVVCPHCGEVMLDSEQEKCSDRSRAMYVMLALTLGTLGAHNFYAGYKGRGVLQCMFSLSIVLCLITVVWILYDIFFVSKDADGLKMR